MLGSTVWISLKKLPSGSQGGLWAGPGWGQKAAEAWPDGQRCLWVGGPHVQRLWSDHWPLRGPETARGQERPTPVPPAPACRSLPAQPLQASESLVVLSSVLG